MESFISHIVKFLTYRHIFSVVVVGVVVVALVVGRVGAGVGLKIVYFSV